MVEWHKVRHPTGAERAWRAEVKAPDGGIVVLAVWRKYKSAGYGFEARLFRGMKILDQEFGTRYTLGGAKQAARDVLKRWRGN
ncbi:MAG: hypothetical protein KGI38_11910 [Thaumarchaeota archaeon]|nr:hypothetical protein [Nitrososphaerota archaeon]